jgi:trehalose-phosphatase
MEHLLERMPRLRNRLGRVFLLLDYDGTLTPIVERPELALLSPDMKKLLRAATARHKVAVISGRALTNLKKLVGLRGIYYVGNHGLEMSGPRVRFTEPKALSVRSVITRICEKLRRELKEIKGALIEDKGLTASVHYRMVEPGELKRLENVVKRVTEAHVRAGEVCLTRSKKVLEIKPAVDWNKGKAALWITRTVDPEERLTPVYLGDDRTDEDAFEALRGRGVTILVSRRPKRSRAKFFLKSVEEVKIFLRMLITVMPPETPVFKFPLARSRIFGYRR